MRVSSNALADSLAEIVGAQNVSGAPHVLANYSSDLSLVRSGIPNCVVWPSRVNEVQGIVKLANEERVPLIPRSSKVGFTGGTVPVQGGVVVDLSRMDKILAIDPRNRMARIEPGVTYGQLQPALAAHNLMSLNPLLPHGSKSVLSSHLERDPMLIPKYEYGDPVLTMEVVLPTGDILRTGSASAPGAPNDTLSDLVGPNGPGLDFYRLLQGAQGTFGIVTWMAVKVEYLPRVEKIFYLPFDALPQLTEVTYRIQRRSLGSECFALNNTYMASIIAEDGKLEGLKASLPPWTLVISIAGGRRRPEERIAYEEEVLDEIAGDYHLPVSQVLPGAPGSERLIARRLRKPWPDERVYWRLRNKGACNVISFHTLFDDVAEIARAAYDFAACAGYHPRDVGCYLQPIERARSCFCELGLSYDPDDPAEVALAKRLNADLNAFLFDRGVLFSRPYGVQAEIVYSRCAPYSNALKELKGVFDPNQVMNPGKLCF